MTINIAGPNKTVQLTSENSLEAKTLKDFGMSDFSLRSGGMLSDNNIRIELTQKQFSQIFLALISAASGLDQFRKDILIIQLADSKLKN